MLSSVKMSLPALHFMCLISFNHLGDFLFIRDNSGAPNTVQGLYVLDAAHQDHSLNQNIDFG